MFDLAAPVSIALESDGIELTLRFPTDQDWFAWARSVAIAKTLGRGGRIIDTQYVRDLSLNHEIVGRYFIEGDRPTFRQARFVLDHLADCAAVQAFPDCETWRVTMRLFDRFDVTHILRSPTPAELRTYDQLCAAMRTETRQANRIVSHVAWEPSVALYDELLLDVHGYARDAVPAPHKSTAVLAVIKELDAQASSPEIAGHSTEGKVLASGLGPR